MDIIKDIGKSLNFKERYDGLERTGMEEYDKTECKQLRELSDSGAPLSESQKETLHYCNTIKGERTRAAMNLGVSGAKVVTGALTGNVGLIGQGIGDAGGYIMSEAQEVDGPNDGIGQQIGKEDYLKLGADVVSGAMTFAGGKGGEAKVPDAPSIEDANASSFANLQSLTSNPQLMQMIAQQGLGGQYAQAAFQSGGAAGGLDFLASYGAKPNNNGSKLKRSTRQHDYIKGNTRGYT